MTSVLAALQNLTTVAFVLLGLATAVTWARHRDRSLGWLALAIILLSSVLVLGRIPQLLHFTVPFLAELDLIFFVGSSYALLRFRAILIPLSRFWHVTAVTAMVVALAVYFLARFLGSVAGLSTQLQTGAALLILIVWALTVIEPCVRFWLVARGLPAVQAWRLRSLSLGFAGIVGILLFALLALGCRAGAEKPSALSRRTVTEPKANQPTARPMRWYQKRAASLLIGTMRMWSTSAPSAPPGASRKRPRTRVKRRARKARR